MTDHDDDERPGCAGWWTITAIAGPGLLLWAMVVTEFAWIGAAAAAAILVVLGWLFAAIRRGGR